MPASSPTGLERRLRRLTRRWSSCSQPDLGPGGAARLATPRQRVPKGSVGIAERQTAIYPLTSPGGWNLIGRCPLTLFSAERGSLLQPGDRVRFVSIDHAEFIRLGGDDTVMEASA